jgi:hypothetical protein
MLLNTVAGLGKFQVKPVLDEKRVTERLNHPRQKGASRFQIDLQ